MSPRLDFNTLGPAALPAPDPRRRIETPFLVGSDVVWPERGSGLDSPASLDPIIQLFYNRWRSWRDGFNRKIAPNAKRYYRLWRNFNDFPLVGPQLGWRDQTVIATAFRIISTRTPRMVMSRFGSREWFTVESRTDKNEQYEEMCRTLLEFGCDQIGRDDPDGENLIVRLIDAFTYCQVIGHVWFKQWWRQEEWDLMSSVPLLNEQGEPTGQWQKVRLKEEKFRGPDLQWLGITDLAIPLRGPRVWSIERVQTTFNTLVDDNRMYAAKYGKDLYKNLDALELSQPVMSGTAAGVRKESYEEPRNFEGWPTEEADRWLSDLGNDRIVEVWLCWDERTRRLTKIGNRAIVLDDGMAPTPRGLSPYFGLKGVPIPKRTYGESILHWVYDLCVGHTRIRRARADEIALNLWQQFAYRIGSITSPKMLIRPGGAIGIQTTDPNRPISDNFTVLPRRPILPEAYQEADSIESTAQKIAGADDLAQGNEATNKSRDVSATEAQQRDANMQIRYQMDSLYQDQCFTSQLLNRQWDLWRQNLTEPITIRLFDKPVQVDLTQIQVPIDIKVGGGIFQLTKAQRSHDVQELAQLAQSPVFGPHLNAPNILKELLRVRDWRNPARFLNAPQAAAAQLQQIQGSQPGGPNQPQAEGAGGMGMPPPPPGPNAPGLPLPGASEGGVPGLGEIPKAAAEQNFTGEKF